MNRAFNTIFVAALAFAISLGSIGAIVTVSPSQAEVPAALALPAIA
jgi:hypothetical protein